MPRGWKTREEMDEDDDYEDKEEEGYERYEFEEENSDGDGEGEEDALSQKASDIIKAWEAEEDLFRPLNPEEENDEIIDLTRYVGGHGFMEHIAGPDCANNGGYGGHRISVEEMRGCCTLQCLIYKEQGWEPEPDDQEWELQGDYFLSGLGDRMPSRDMGSPDVTPARHGVYNAWADTCIWTVSSMTPIP